MWVIKNLISEEQVKLLYKNNLLNYLAKCSKQIIVDKIIEYLENPENDKEVVTMLTEVYKDKLNFLDEVVNEDTINSITELSKLTYYSIVPSLELETLKRYEQLLESIYKEEWNVPYINPISSSIINELITNLLGIYKATKDKECQKLAYILSKNKELFKDSTSTHPKGTIFKNLYKRKEELSIIYKGVKFLIDKKERNVPKQSWRIF